MADIYKVNSNNIVGGPGRLVVADFGIPYPNTIEDVMNLTEPYDLKPGWSDLGATSDGIATSRGFDVEGFEVDQLPGEVDSDITAWTHTLETTLAENTLENRQLALIGAPIIETPSVLGTATTTTGDVAAGATIVPVTSVAGITPGSYVDVDGETRKVSRVEGTSIYLETSLAEAHVTGATVSPITTLGTRRIGYGTPNEVPFKTYALISQKKDGTLYMAVFRKAKVSGDDKEQTFGKEKRLLPLQLVAYPDSSAPQEENVYYEIEQTT
ncbi:hypothetical protein [Fictibacillus sp. NRS-1165]|uniref:hypothetical protein n=1 Tax=Fictibacillus sp. NRS-1165 TaxID=3144463 RepID=UPI003D252BDB